MLTLGQQKIDTLTLGVVAVLGGVLGVLSVGYPTLLPWCFLGLVGAAVVIFWVIKWEITLWAWLWVLSYGLLDWGGWRIEITGFFNMTVPRFIFLGAVGAFGLHLLIRSRPHIRFDRALLWVMLSLAVYCAISATAAGWLARTEPVRTAPYFRFLGGLLFPFVIFFFVYNCTHSERQIRAALILLSIYGWYALYIGYLQYIAIMGASGAREWIWPSYINNPDYGIHFDRARGAFGSGSQQAIFLILLFYSTLYLMRKIRGPYRFALIVQAILIPPAIFFTGMRSAYLGFGLCAILWSLVAARRRFGVGKLLIFTLVGVIGAMLLWSNLTGTVRQTGGVGQRGPVEARMLLLRQTWELFKGHPLTGVGFGHFADAQYQLARDPSGLGNLSTSLLVEHNLFLSMLSETGLVGLVGIVVVFVLLFRQSRQLYRRLPPTAQGYLSRGFVVLFWVAMVNYLTDAMFRDTYWDVAANGLFWSLGGLVVGFNRLLEPHSLDLPLTGVIGEG